MRMWLAAIREESRYLGIAAVVFITSAIAGFANGEAILESMKQMGIIDQLEQVMGSISKEPTFANAFIIIFLNNLLASLKMIVFGLLLGIIPFMAMLTNGMVLGVVLDAVAKSSGQHPLAIFVGKVLPHGVLELPAIILAAAIGIRLGMAGWRRFLALLVPDRREGSIQEWKGIRARLPRLILIITLLLAVAAVIESGLIVSVKQ
ncbi:stage II sporulation protein M [Laceyella sacchari]|uniref:Stage II sporulation protein M n=1 Tax=Laceyella sacchari TaxID=37482 RepID=A0ABY5U5P8_LACSH|nr:stage II sporulation protein M [Laceyella sacchari]TCW36720.1 stage II sporulation protein M [Laceyella sacchari]UWE03900.1 stage II sporulation protein M [Laceyella sacchari]